MNKQNGWELCKTPCIYFTMLDSIFWREVDKQGLNRKDVIEYWHKAIGISFNYILTSVNSFILYIQYGNVNSIDIIGHRHQLKQFVKEIAICAHKETINNPVNNAVGWRA